MQLSNNQLRVPASPVIRTLLTAAGLVLGAACNAGTAEAPASPETVALLRELIGATTLPPASSGALVKGDWFDRRDRAQEGALAAPPAAGTEALRIFREEEELPLEARQALLRIAAHHAPEDTTPVLLELVQSYGPPLDLRKEACDVLAGCAPQLAIEVLTPLVRDSDQSGTYPPAESMLAAVVTASRTLSVPVDELLARIATDIYHESSVRHRAVRELGDERGWRAEKALEQVLIESTGNAYLRRLAAQAMLRAMEPAAACEVFQRVYDREADDRFMVFLADVIQRNCNDVGGQ